MAEKLFGCVIFGSIAAVLMVWTVRDLRRGKTVIEPIRLVSRSEHAVWFWLQIGLQGLLAAAFLFGVVRIALA